MDQQELNSLIKQLKEVDNSCLKAIYESCAEHCIRKLTLETNISQEEAEDTFIDAIMNFREKLIGDKIDHLISEKAYIYKTCYNMYLVRLEQTKRWNRKLSDIEMLYYGAQGKDDSEFDQNMLDATKSAWNRLSEKCKDIISYFYVDKISMTEIAELMGLNNADVAKTTKSRCFKKFTSFAHETLKESV
ncbi:MAG: sigma-70 family RNA polymerase sigma factor [Bacteroidota bacterium]